MYAERPSSIPDERGDIATFPTTLLARIHLASDTATAPTICPTVAHTYSDGPPFIIAQNLAQRADGLTAAFIGEPAATAENPDEVAKETDADALLCLYETWGTDCLKNLTGSWALIIADPLRKRVVVATDRMARQPLYFRVDDGVALIGSSLDSVREIAGMTGLDPQALYHYLYFHMIPAPDAVVAGCHKLAPATMLEITPDAQRLRRYWNPTFSETFPGPKATAHAALRTHLRTAVARCISARVAPRTAIEATMAQSARHADQRLGVFLSGGLDSSTVAGMFSELHSGVGNAYAIGFDVEGYDELPYARVTATHFGLKLNEYYVTPDDVVNALPKVAAAFDEPFGNSSALPTYFCARLAAADGTDLLLAGDGGDELFAGNTRYAHQILFEHYRRTPGWLRSHVLEPVVDALPDALPLAGKGRSFVHQANISLPDRLYHYGFLERNPPEEVFSQAFLQQVDESQPPRLLRNIYQKSHNASALNRMLYLDWQITLSDNDLRKVTQACALAGITVRFPMLDEDLVAFSTTLPSAWKLPDTMLSKRLLKGSRLRHFYKEALAGWLPDATIRKHKHGFGLPFGLWMKNYRPLQELAYDCIVALKARAIFKPDFLEQAIALHRDGHAPYYGELIWILMSLELWLKIKLPDYHYE
ncbi:MAG: asparagine synthase-related protein [Porticoccaceae bacterium]